MSDIINLVKKAQKGNVNAFTKLFHLYESDIYRIAFVYVKNKEDALDIVQETAYRSLKSISKLKKPEYFKTWVIRIAINCAMDIIRIQQKVTQIQKYVDIFTGNDDETIPNSITLKDILDLLDEREKEVIILRFYNKCTIKEVAVILNIPLGTTKTILYKALQKLRKEWQGDDIGER